LGSGTETGSVRGRKRDPQQTTVYQLPTTIVFGPGSIARLGEHLSELGVRKPLLVSDQGLVSAGIVGQVLERALASGAEIHRFELTEPPLSEIFVMAVEDGSSGMEVGAA
jgi:alcohol dehydrogenase class IV